MHCEVHHCIYEHKMLITHENEQQQVNKFMYGASAGSFKTTKNNNNMTIENKLRD